MRDVAPRLGLEARGVSKRYGARNALSGVDLIVRPGEMHGLLGPNGAGKTTLLRILFGLVRHDAGTVHVLGSSVDSQSGGIPDGVAGFVDTPAFYPYLSGRKNLMLVARLDSDSSRRRERVDEALVRVGLGADAHVAVGAYSAGMRQRLGLAAALLRSPRVLLLDEPTNALDPGGARDLRALARLLADEGAAVLWSSHDLTEVEELCSTITVLNRGEVVFSGAVDELRRRAPATVHSLRTSDDFAALELAERHGVKVAPGAEGALEAFFDGETLDAYVIALGTAGIAVRLLERRARSLESVFLELTGHSHASGRGTHEPSSAAGAAPSSTVSV